VDPFKIIRKYYADHPEAYRFVVEHAGMVAGKALEVAGRVGHLAPDLGFIEEAAILHDIGIFMIHAPHLGCHGDKPYICHGYLGRELLEKEGLKRHALVSERHVGTGLTVRDIRENSFPLPERDMIPQSIEEQIICFADKFYSKDSEPLKEKPVPVVRGFIARYGEDKLRIFDDWLRVFGY
jgi:uncharacterized protein